LVDQLPIPAPGHLYFLAGKTPNGQVVVKDLATLPHLLVAGTTGSGKTVFLQGILLSLLHRLSAQQLSLLIVDPKRTDFAVFNPLPHLRGGAVINDPEAAIQELHSLTDAELETRTEMMIDAGVQNLLEYNQHMANDPLRPIVVLIDEYADLVDVLTKAERQAFEVEVQRLAQRARSVGIHLIIATQRPTADVVTGRLKSNLPARVAFRLPASRDSLVILDDPGAENLLGKGDMLFLEEGVKTRMQGFFTNTPDLRAFVRKVSQ
jgi:DNA segregation ATPase FtsK/SpoIIIE-like protein